MKKFIAVVFALLAAVGSHAQRKQTEIVVIGNIHQAVPNYNADTLLQMMERIQPDLILHEVDSSFFTKDFRFKAPSKENEQNASVRYLQKHPRTLLRPFEFEGRNEYRRARGMVPADNLTIQLLNRLDSARALTPEQQGLLTAYHALTDSLKVLAAQSPRHFNNPATDALARRRQDLQHKGLTRITNARDEFATAFLTKPNGEQISYREGYQLWADFWDLRNQTMARNIVRMAEKFPGKRVVVLTGFLHRYYLLSELQKLTAGKNIQIREFYDYQHRN
ncbi:hypothetical protein [Rufibacter quisquiliarum]|uniref:TraB/GumN family protein n=1 Tax=Rufibacter quisquiliarum TaxID=1549639 RepID=A0A839GEH5_9BACT|nr:hypothetical protein [Rufibacter quisquiliarum]MBA9076850.1 hypothetical protein [Rufibacter quisquiliarum]